MKTGLLVEGGGMKDAYSAGVLDAFLDHRIHFDVVTGVSAGAANAASFLGGQRDRNRRFYVMHSQDPRYFGVKNLLKTGSLFGLKYIYGEMSAPGGADPLNFDGILENPAGFFFPATDAKTGNPHYFGKSDLSGYATEPFEATCALPVMCQPISFQGHEYFDGGCTDSLPIRQLMKRGAGRVVVLFSKPDDFHMEPQAHRVIYTGALQKYPRIIYRLNHRHEVYNRQVDAIIRLRSEGRALTFAPDDSIRMKTTTTDPAIMQKLYDNGYEDGMRRAGEVKSFLGL